MKHTKFIALLLTAVLLLTIFPVSMADTLISNAITLSEEDVDPWEIIVVQGKCGEDIKWRLRGDGCLEIIGTGEMYDYEKNKVPWLEFADSIKYVYIDYEVTSLCSYAFLNCRNITEVEVSYNMSTIKKGTFSGCSSLEGIKLEQNITSIEKNAFYGCKKLEYVKIDNPDAEIYDSENTIYKSVTVCGFADSSAQTYAKKYNREFVLIDKPAAALRVGGSVEIKPTYEHERFYFKYTPAESGWYVVYSQGCKGKCDIIDPENGLRGDGMSGNPTDFVNKKYLKEGLTYEFEILSVEKDKYTVYFDKCSKAEKIVFQEDCIDEYQNDMPIIYEYAYKYVNLYYEYFPITAYEESVSWSSSDKKIATVNEYGEVSFISPGTATITVKSEKGLIAKCKVIVLEPKNLALNSLERFDLSKSLAGYEQFLFTTEVDGEISFSVQKQHADEDAPGRVIVELYEESEDGLTFVNDYYLSEDSKTFFIDVQAEKEYLFSIYFQDLSGSEEKDMPKVSIYMQQGKHEYVFAKPGDVDGNDVVNSADARFALRAAVGLETLSAAEKSYADVNHDGKITSADARLILRCAVGLETL